MEAHVWLVDLDAADVDVASCAQLLSSGEQHRASRFRFPTDRRRYIVSHASLRSVLALYAALAPEDLEFFTSENGKPALTATSSQRDVQFNLSHSGELALIAVIREQRIGVDLECVRESFSFAGVAERVFSTEELTVFTALPPHVQPLTFYQCWVVKEALAKARGTGLSWHSSEIDMALTRDDTVAITAISPGWRVSSLQPGQGYVGAVAVEGHAPDVRCIRWDTQRLTDRRRAPGATLRGGLWDEWNR